MSALSTLLDTYDITVSLNLINTNHNFSESLPKPQTLFALIAQSRNALFRKWVLGNHFHHPGLQQRRKYIFCFQILCHYGFDNVARYRAWRFSARILSCAVGCSPKSHNLGSDGPGAGAGNGMFGLNRSAQWSNFPFGCPKVNFRT